MLDRLPVIYTAPRPMQGHRTWSMPTQYRRPPVVQRAERNDKTPE